MTTVTIQDVIDDNVKEGGETHYVYVVRADETVLYVGKSKRSAIERLGEHLGIGGVMACGVPSSQLGELITSNAPESHQWQVQLLTLEDCRPYVVKHLSSVVRWDEDKAEIAVIQSLCPCLNRMYNPRPQRIPDHWRKSIDERMRDRLENPAESFIRYDAEGKT
ncbi:MAG TPA: hypothetical protein VFD70_02390 [Anaerolineae bacterium]|nr:hypothetical protein [Anaerolineae bacterium]